MSITTHCPTCEGPSVLNWVFQGSRVARSSLPIVRAKERTGVAPTHPEITSGLRVAGPQRDLNVFQTT